MRPSCSGASGSTPRRGERPWRRNNTPGSAPLALLHEETAMSLITYAPPPSAAPAPAGPRTLRDLFTAYLGDVALEHQPSTQYQQRMFYQMVLQEFGPLPLEDVTPDLLRAWKAH